MTTRRECGGCQLCCKLLPVPPLQKKAGQRCRFQKFGKGCAVYHTPKMPFECGMWNCRWLVNDDADDLSRPDRSHYVIDLMPDFVTLRHDDSGELQNIQVVQVWVDPDYPDAHRDPALRRYLIRRAHDGIAALIRFDASKALTVFAPPFAEDGQWHEIDSDAPTERTHTLAEVENALGSRARLIAEK
jgi:hypothetical protein